MVGRGPEPCLAGRAADLCRPGAGGGPRPPLPVPLAAGAGSRRRSPARRRPGRPGAEPADPRPSHGAGRRPVGCPRRRPGRRRRAGLRARTPRVVGARPRGSRPRCRHAPRSHRGPRSPQPLRRDRSGGQDRRTRGLSHLRRAGGWTGGSPVASSGRCGRRVRGPAGPGPAPWAAGLGAGVEPGGAAGGGRPGRIVPAAAGRLADQPRGRRPGRNRRGRRHHPVSPVRRAGVAGRGGSPAAGPIGGRGGERRTPPGRGPGAERRRPRTAGPPDPTVGRLE